MIPLLDVLQSIPVLSFLPGVMLAMVALFPGRQLGVEAGAILLIFTGQVWNMAFSFYASLKSIPKEMREAAKVYQFSWWQRFIEMELPFCGHRSGVELDDVGGGRLVLPDGLRDVRARFARLPVARPRIVSANCGQRGRYTIDSLGRRHHDRGHCAARPVRLASGDRMGGEVQSRAGGEQRRPALVGARHDSTFAQPRCIFERRPCAR